MGEAAQALQAVPVLPCRDAHSAEPVWELCTPSSRMPPMGCDHLFRKSRLEVVKVKSLFSPTRCFPKEPKFLWPKEQEVMFWANISWWLRKE